MKKVYFFLSLFILITLACNASINIPTAPAPQPTDTTIPATEPATTTPEIFISLTQAMPATPVPGTLITIGRLTLEIPSSVASGASGGDIAPVTNEDAAYWEKTPGHLQVSLNDGYVLQGKFLQPQIRVYPAVEYATLVPGAFESMHRLQNIISAVVPSTPDQLPAVPFFNASQDFASNFQSISFQNGHGVRFLTQYDQYPAPVNNNELFYHFQGFSADGNYYIVAILPITAPILTATSDPGSILPSGGIAYPDINGSNPDFQAYYASITDLLNSTSPEAFTPSLGQLDALIQSMWVAP